MRKSAKSEPVSLPSKLKLPFGAHVLRSLICRYRNSPPNLSECLPTTFEKLSEKCHVLLGWNVVSVGTPMEKLLNETGGTVSGKPDGPEGRIPSVPGAVSKPRSASFAKLPVGSFVTVAVRKKLTRNSFTCDAPNVFVLLITTCCAREGVVDGNPGTLAAFIGSWTVESSK